MAGMHNMLMGIGGGLADTQTVTAKYFYANDGKTGEIGPYYGYTTLGAGSIADGTSNIYGGNGFLDFLWSQTGPIMRVSMYGAGITNSGWSKLVITHTYSETVRIFYRSAAAFSQYVSGEDTTTEWSWPSATNVFSNITDGQNVYICKFYR